MLSQHRAPHQHRVAHQRIPLLLILTCNAIAMEYYRAEGLTAGPWAFRSRFFEAKDQSLI